MTLSTFAFIFTGVLLNACAQLLLKAGVNAVGAITIDRATLFSTALRVLTQWPVIGGLTLYVVSVGVWIIGLSRVDVSIAYPMLSLGYVVNALAAYWLFGEMIGPLRMAGIVLILAGVFLIARS
ncbi:MAG: 4-amino-4-deoxy-L-arabinose transferase [Cupriavidus sp.]|jgi:multidrug transporter EmrE-like cation transporter|uniref:DMT family transporter n=1 Tax=Cupriavidus pauculus TaxID=82633 RepID=UPI00078377AC|nr:EamA family transporter [Cupriavidus pauculus]MBU67835.1 4-amino-4-deoxy-L-arabinose transferase [Cupriavidus sp.]KAB0602236.1 EamA family transporter [Cupriavidus pauculus]MBY4733026.1 EamA family transporter [Cupriavidus pauculus]MCM3605558.1 EamA family transporter [Cupriavidus pauculus]UAL02450.1 EamA family transporter [Cupriavidus pauculus]